MKNTTYLVLALFFVLLWSCNEESLQEIGDPELYVSLPGTAPSTAFPNKEISFPVEVFAAAGLDKVEVRVNFQSLEGTGVNTFEDPKNALYNFSYTPTNTDLGKTLEFVLVVYDQDGFTDDVTYSVSIVPEPVIISLTLPDVLPDTLEVGDVLDFEIEVSSEDELEKIETLYNDAALPALTLSSFENPFVVSYRFTYEIQPADGGQDITFIFKATDVEQKSKEISYTLYVIGKRVPLPVDTYESVVMGMQSNGGTGPFIDLATNTVYAVPGAKNNSALVDIGAFRSGSSGINLFAPSYSNAAQFIYNARNWGDDNLGTWPVRNETEIRRISSDLLSVEDFNTMADDERMLEVFELSDPSVEFITQSAEGEIVGFKTVDGKHGLILIKSLVATSSGTITFDYKIQQ